RCRRRPTARSTRRCSTALSTRRRKAPKRPAPAPRGVHRRSRGVADMLGRLTWDAIPFDQPLPLYSMGVVVLALVGVLILVVAKGWLPYLWNEWITSVDHKRIGAMYVLLGLIMLLRGFADAIMMRSHQALAVGGAQGYLPPDHYDQIFSAHGTIMIFF